jgi:hypothetical protein
MLLYSRVSHQKHQAQFLCGLSMGAEVTVKSLRTPWRSEILSNPAGFFLQFSRSLKFFNRTEPPRISNLKFLVGHPIIRQCAINFQKYCLL